MFDLRQVFQVLRQARWMTDDCANVALSGVSTDSRSVQPGELFVALQGEHFDGHAFVAVARRAGAAAVLVERWDDAYQMPAILVPDCRQALGEIARSWRSAQQLPVIAVTGSNGKTTVKEMIATVLAVHWGRAARWASPGNLNNEIGVPLSVLKLRAEHRVAVFEIGMNHPGEIAVLAAIAQPTVALVNNAQREHQEFMHTVEATARENGQVFGALPTDGIAVFPGDDLPHAPIWRALAGARRCVEFGRAEHCLVRASPDAVPEAFEMHIAGQRVAVRLSIDGQHNVANALAAAAACYAVGVPPAAIAAGLAAFEPMPGRLRRIACGSSTVIDDSYNANPDSVRAAIDVLAGMAGRPRVLVLGDMGEVGVQGPQFHTEMGGYARDCGIEALLAFGTATRDAVAAFGAGAEHCDAMTGLIERACSLAQGGATLLVKGSRSMRMERVVAALIAMNPPAGGAH